MLGCTLCPATYFMMGGTASIKSHGTSVMNWAFIMTMSNNIEHQHILRETPGGSKFGSFIDYYRFHPVSTRINNIPSSLLTNDCKIIENNIILDIGSNSGVITK